MAYQKLFRNKYVDHLIENVNQGVDLEKYYGHRFDYDESEILSVPKIFQPEDLKYKMKPNDNCASAIALFEAFPTISALQAADNRLWIYLAIADLFTYVRTKWACKMPDSTDPDREEKMKTNIRIHWFGLTKDSFTFAPMRHALSNLWWSVYVSVDRKATTLEDKYKYTHLLFNNETFRTRTATGFLGRNREALYGILDFMERCPQLFEGTKDIAFREITKFLNCIGGGLQLSFMKRDFFLHQLLDNKDLLTDRIISQGGLKNIDSTPLNPYTIEESSPSIVSEPGYTDYINIRETVTSMINNPRIK